MVRLEKNGILSEWNLSTSQTRRIAVCESYANEFGSARIDARNWVNQEDRTALRQAAIKAAHTARIRQSITWTIVFSMRKRQKYETYASHHSLLPISHFTFFHLRFIGKKRFGEIQRENDPRSAFAKSTLASYGIHDVCRIIRFGHNQ